jgi:hypothetical protein
MKLLLPSSPLSMQDYITFIKISTSVCVSLGDDIYILRTGLSECSGVLGKVCLRLDNTVLQSSVKKNNLEIMF